MVWMDIIMVWMVIDDIIKYLDGLNGYNDDGLYMYMDIMIIFYYIWMVLILILMFLRW